MKLSRLLTAALALFALSSAPTAMAYDTQVLKAAVSSLTNEGYYYIYDAHADDGTDVEQTSNDNCRYAFRFDSGNATDVTAIINGTHSKPQNSIGTLENKHVWQALSVGDNLWQFKNVATGRYMSKNRNNNNRALTTSVEEDYGSFELEPNSGQTNVFHVKINGTDNRHWDGNGGAGTPMVYWDGSGHDIKFFGAVAKADGTYDFDTENGWDITYAFPEHNGVVYQKTISVSGDANVTEHIPSLEFFTATGLTDTDLTISENNKTFHVAGTYNFPFAFNHVYHVTLRAEDRKPLKYDGTNALTNYNDDSFGPAVMWYFKYKGFGNNGELKLTLHNLSAGDNVGVTMSTSNEPATFTTTPTELLYFASTKNDRQEGDFCLRSATNNQIWVNEFNGDGKLATWSTSNPRSDMGSQIRFAELIEEDFEIVSLFNSAEDIAAAKANPTPTNITALFNNLNTNLADEYSIISNANTFIHMGLASTDGASAWNNFLKSIKEAEGGDDTHNSIIEAYQALVASSSNLKNDAHIKLSAYVAQNDYLIINFSNHAFNVERYGTSHNVNKTTWTLKPAEGGFKMFNEYSGKYINLPQYREEQSSNTLLTRVQPVDEDNAGIFTFELQDAASGRCGIKSVASPNDYLHTNTTTNVVKWDKGDNSSWYLHASDAETAANEANIGANADVADAQNNFHKPGAITEGNSVGEYSGNVEEYNAALTVFNALNDDSTNAEKHAAAAALREHYPTLTLHTPQAGHFYRLSGINNNVNKFLSSAKNGGNLTIVLGSQSDGEGTDNTLSTVFYYDGTKFVSLETGEVIIKNGSAAQYTSTIYNGENAPSLEITETNNYCGKFFLKIAGRYVYNAHASFDSGTSYGTDDGYRWKISEVTWVPVPNSEGNSVAVNFPMPLSLLEFQSNNTKADAFTINVEGNKVVFNQIEGTTIPANTNVVLHFVDGVSRNNNNGLVYLQPLAPEEGVENYTSAFTVSKAEGENYLSFNGGKFVEATADTRQGFMAHIQVESIPEGGFSTREDKLHDVLNGVEGKVYTIHSTDGRGYLIHKDGKDVIYTSNVNNNGTTVDRNDANFQWTFVKDDAGNSYLYNLGAQKFASLYMKSDITDTNCHAEFVWHFSDYPTAVYAAFEDWAEQVWLSESDLNIFGGQNNHDKAGSRKPGMLIVNGYTDSPVPGISGNTHRDGNGFKFTEVAYDELPELPTADDIEAAKAKMEQAFEHAKVLNQNVENNVAEIGFYAGNAATEFNNKFVEGFNAETAEEKYYAVVRAHAAVTEKSYNGFNEKEAYQLHIGDQYINAENNDLGWALGTMSTDEKDLYSNWHVELGEGENQFVFSHVLRVPAPETEVAPAAVRRRADAEEPEQKFADRTVSFTATPSYDGLGNVTLNVEGLNGAVRVSSLGDDTNKEQTTGIREVELSTPLSADVYDLQGRLINKPGHGLYIVNGKKVRL